MQARLSPFFRSGSAAARALVGLWLLLAAGAAEAHAFVISSVPAANAAISGGEVILDLQFNSRIDSRRARLVLVGPLDTRRELAIAGDPRPDRLSSQIGTLPSGDYRIEWYVLSPDGHVTRGYVPFRVHPD